MFVISLGIYPQIGWKIEDDVIYICEGNITGIAASIEWAKQIGLSVVISFSLMELCLLLVLK